MNIATYIGFSGVLLACASFCAEAADVRQGFSFCTVTNLSNFKTFATPVFSTTYAPELSFQRTQELATEFHAAVSQLGGSGEKNCYPLEERAAQSEGQRAEHKRLATSAFLSKWQDVPFTPKPWNASQLARTGDLTKYYFCEVADPGRNVRKAAATGVFEGRVPASDQMAPYTLAGLYTEEFKRAIAAGLGMSVVNASCTFKDTFEEATSSRSEAKRPWTGVSGFNTTFVDLDWRPSARLQIGPVPQTGSASPNVASGRTTAPSVAIGDIQASLGPLNGSLAESLGLTNSRGALVVSVVEGGVSARAGLKPLDVVLEFAGQEISDSEELKSIVARTRAGYGASLRVWRKREIIETNVIVAAGQAVGGIESRVAASTLAPNDIQGATEPKNPISAGQFLGLVVSDLTDAKMRDLRLDTGVNVDQATEAAARAGIREGDVILGIDAMSTRNVKEFEAAAARTDRTKSVVVLLRRGLASQFALIRPIR